MNSLDSSQWLKVMQEEINSINKNEVQELTGLPQKRNVIGCKWFLKKKLNSDITLGRYKVRPVTKGLYIKTLDRLFRYLFPIVEFISIRILQLYKLNQILNYFKWKLRLHS